MPARGAVRPDGTAKVAHEEDGRGADAGTVDQVSFKA